MEEAAELNPADKSEERPSTPPVTRTSTSAFATPEKAASSQQESVSKGKKSGKKGKTPSRGKAKEDTKAEAQDTKTRKPKKGTKRTNDAVTTTSPSTAISSPPVKKAKTEAGAVKTPAPTTPAAKPADTGPTVVTEDEIRKILLKNTHMKTPELINHFRRPLKDETQKTKFTDIIKKIAVIVDDGGNKYLRLRPEYK